MAAAETQPPAPAPAPESAPAPDQRVAAAAASFTFSAAHANAAVHHMVQHLDSALHSHGATQIPSFISRIPTGRETGVFLGVDLGGTNCRVCSVQFHGDSTYTLLQATHEIPRPVMTEHNYRPLFLFIARCISDFLAAHPQLLTPTTSTTTSSTTTTTPPPPKTLPLGFIFSFTFEQHSLGRGTLLQWDKGWTIPSAIGRDPCAMLQEAVDEVHLPVSVCALANDSVGTLLARAYTTPGLNPRGPLIGAIFGTGTNAAYAEQRAKVHKMRGPDQAHQHQDEGLMLINTEWGACFDDNGAALAPTPYDDALDAASTNPGLQILEKRVGGMYLGELLRLAVLDLYNAGVFSFTLVQPSASAPAALLVENAVDSEILSVLATPDDDEGATAFVQKTLGVCGVSSRDLAAIRTLGGAIGARAARIAGVAVAAIIIQSGRLGADAASSSSSTEGPADQQQITKQEEQDEDEETQEADCGAVFAMLSRALKSVLSCFMPPSSSDSPAPASTPTKASPALSGTQTFATASASDVIDIGVDGSLIEFYPSFEVHLRSALRDINEIGVAGEERVTIGLAKNGSSIGAAMAALYQSAEAEVEAEACLDKTVPSS